MGEPQEPSLPLPGPPTPKLQIDLSSCVTLAVCSLSPHPLCFDQDQMFFFTSSGLCLSEWTLGKTTEPSQPLPAPAPTQSPPSTFRLRVQLGLPRVQVHLCAEVGNSQPPESPSLPSSVLLEPRF